MKTTWGSWSIEPEGCILLLPLLRSQHNFFRQFLQKRRFLLQAQWSCAALWWEPHLAITGCALLPVLRHTTFRSQQPGSWVAVVHFY